MYEFSISIKISFLKQHAKFASVVSNADAVAKVKYVFFCIYLSNIFAEVRALKKNRLISIKIFSFYLFIHSIVVSKFIEICNIDCSLLSLASSYSYSTRQRMKRKVY